MLHLEDAPIGQHRIPMLHQPQVIGVITPDVIQIVREVLPLREQLLEHREPAGQRLAPGIDDPGIRQDQVNQPDVAEVVGHLVDEMRRARVAVDPGGGDVAVAQRGQFIAGQRGNIGGVAIGIFLPEPPVEPRGNRHDIGQFGGPFHLAVRGKDLFEQG